MLNFIACFLTMTLLGFTSFSLAEQVPEDDRKITLRHVAGIKCTEKKECENANVIVFVHGIYGDETTFKNGDFIFPVELEKALRLRSNPVALYTLNYKKRLITWSKKEDVLFVDLASEVMSLMERIAVQNPRSIGFIAHSLGGNVVTTYVVTTKLRYGHPEKAKTAYLVTLDTPFLGAQIANLAETIRGALAMPSDGLLKSLELNNVYLEMLRLMRRYETEKGDDFGCRPTNLYVLYSKKSLHGVPVVGEDSQQSMNVFLRAQNTEYKEPIGYPLDHAQIAKPASTDDPVFRDVLQIVSNELERVEKWNVDHHSDTLCLFTKPRGR